MDDRVRMLRETLYLAAKADRNRRFHALFDKVCRKDILSEAWNTVERNGGTHGIDNVRILDIENSEEFIQNIAQELKQHTYRPSPSGLRKEGDRSAATASALRLSVPER